MKCKKCDGEVEIDFTKQLLSDPPKYTAKCKKCGNIEYILCSECHSTEGSCLQSIYGAGKINYVGDVIVGSDGTNSCQKPSFTSCYISSIPPQTTEECKIQPKQFKNTTKLLIVEDGSIDLENCTQDLLDMGIGLLVYRQGSQPPKLYDLED